jgi:hypothetical protein
MENVMQGQPKLDEWTKADTRLQPAITTDSHKETKIWTWKRKQ